MDGWMDVLCLTDGWWFIVLSIRVVNEVLQYST